MIQRAPIQPFYSPKEYDVTNGCAIKACPAAGSCRCPLKAPNLSAADHARYTDSRSMRRQHSGALLQGLTIVAMNSYRDGHSELKTKAYSPL